jgi:hypothetical protein
LFFAWFPRYGLKLTSHITRAIPLIFAALAVVFLLATASNAQSLSWWGSNHWFDWSDFRASGGIRYFFPRLTWGTATLPGTSINNADLTGPQLAFLNDPEPFADVWGIFYLDRVGFTFAIETHRFISLPTPRPFPDTSGLLGRWELKGDTSRAGIDLELIRYPFLRLGINYDAAFDDVKFTREDIQTFVVPPPGAPVPVQREIRAIYQGIGPMTIGFHGRVIPGRLRGIPITAQGRVRFPIPYLKRKAEAKVTDWEVSGGLRPSIWETSLFGGTTFAVGLEGGFRAISLEMIGAKDNLSPENNLIPQFPPLPPGFVALPSQVDLKAHWQGAFIQVELFF